MWRLIAEYGCGQQITYRRNTEKEIRELFDLAIGTTNARLNGRKYSYVEIIRPDWSKAEKWGKKFGSK